MNERTSAVIMLVTMFVCGTYLMTHGYAIVGGILLGIIMLGICS